MCRRLDAALTACLHALVHLYQVILSPSLGGACRFLPSCSVYAQQALRRHGSCFGTIYTVRRLLRCHPWHQGPTLDEVPAIKKRRRQ